MADTLTETTYRVDIRLGEDEWLTSITTDDPDRAAREYDTFALGRGPKARIVQIETIRSENEIDREEL